MSVLPKCRRILVVEDDADLRALLELSLSRAGLQVHTVADGRAALETLRTVPFDAILLDLYLPRMDGWELRVRQKLEPSIRDIPVIVMTGDSTPKARAIDAAMVVSKPVDGKTLAGAIHQILDTRDRANDHAQKLVQIDRLACLGAMTAGVVHELNSPLSYVITNLEFLGMPHSRTPAMVHEAGEALRDAQDGAARMKTIVRELLGFSRRDTRGAAVFRVDEMVASALRMVHMTGADCTWRVAACQRDAAVLGDPVQLVQVVVNLLVNAAQAMEAAKVQVREVVITQGLANGTVTVDIVDTGPGVPPSLRGRIFDPFFTTKGPSVGTGLGLAISRTIIESHGGALTLEESDEGAHFRISLPAAVSAELPASPAQMPLKARAG